MMRARVLSVGIVAGPAVLAAALGLALLHGCTDRSGTRFVPPRGDGGDGDDGGALDGGGHTGFVDSGPRPDAGPSPGSCSDRARWIYLVDSGNALLRYEPDSDAITRIGTLACAAGASPFSMAVDRDANAYVLHGDHRIYRASTADASCAPTTFVPNQMGLELFGMGFVSDAEGSDAETLFVAGGPESSIGLGSSTLARIDVASWSLSTIGGVSGSPELTGTGTAQLWGFFPDSSPMSVRQLDKTTGGTLRTIDVSAVDPSGFGVASAWAFAFWGGRFYIFYQGLLDSSTGIWRVTPDAGTVEPVRTNIGYRIVGAGVSTCAPTILI